MNKCTCGTKTADHSIFCSGDFYIDPMSEKNTPLKKTMKNYVNDVSCYLR